MLSGGYIIWVYWVCAPSPWVPGTEYIWDSSDLVTVQYRCYHELTNVTFIMVITIVII